MLESQILQGEALDKAIVAKIANVLDSLESSKQKSQALVVFPRWLFPYLSDFSVKVGRALSAELPETEKAYSPYYRFIIQVLGFTPTAEAINLLFDEMEVAPPYKLKENPIYGERGVLGELAKAIVENGMRNEPKYMDGYAQLIVDREDTAFRHVLVWALGQTSHQFADFDFLLRLRDVAPELKADIDIALNKVAINLEFASDPEYRVRKDSSYGAHYFQVYVLSPEERKHYAEDQAKFAQQANQTLNDLGIKDRNAYHKP